jgi:hypothetical protein
MPKIVTEITYDWSEIQELIEHQLGRPLKVAHIEIRESGSHDHGDYKLNIKSITFTPNEETKRP